MSKATERIQPKRRTPLTREQLSPLAPATARALSLKSHLALIALRQGHGNTDHVSELRRVLYLTVFANEAGKPNVPFDTFLAAEPALKACIHRAVTADEWRLEAAHCEVFETVLRAYDAQPRNERRCRFTRSNRRKRAWDGCWRGAVFRT